MATRRRIDQFYYITHIDNLTSIVKAGILAHSRIENEGINYTPIYNPSIVSNRRQRLTPDSRSLWEFANLYFQPRNAMLYQVLQSRPPEQVVVLGSFFTM